MSTKRCCVPECTVGKSHQTLHLFPNPLKDKARFDEWILAIGGDILALNNDDIYKYRRVCHAHFEEKYCCRLNRISNIAVPTLNMPSALPTLPIYSFVERRPMRQIQNVSVVNPPPLPGSSATDSSLKPPSAIVEELYQNMDPVGAMICHPGPSALQKTETTVKRFKEGQVDAEGPHITKLAGPSATQTAAAKEVGRGLINTKPSFSAIQLTDKVIEKVSISKPARKTGKKYLTSTEHKLHQRITKLRIKISKCRNKIKWQSANIKAAKNVSSNPAFLAALEKMSFAAKTLTLLQFKEIGKKSKGRRFTLEEKIIALSILKQTPKGYKFLRKMFVLPAPQTLAKLISQANIKPGINKKIFNQLKNVAKNMKTEERLCLLIFDEMFLKANLSFNERKDHITGFVTDGSTTKPDFADHAQVFMIRGLVKNYKMATAYTFSAAGTSGQEIKKQIKENITALQEAGFIVVGTICDQGANNRLGIKLLIQETRGVLLRAGEEPKENIILINNQEIVALYDPPHLLKCIRNNLLTKDLEYTFEGRKHVAKWDHLLLLHKENPGYKGVRLIPKLTDNHVLPEKLKRNKMKVKLATQIFSRNVGTNMGYLADKKILPQECKETADILLFFDNLFDSLNGSFLKKAKQFGKPLLGPVTPSSIHHKHWAEAKRMLSAMKFINKSTGKTENVPTLNNWVWTLDSVEVLLKNMNKKYQVTSVWMRHLNQDPLENFFGAVRSHGCRNTNPTPENFESTFVTMLINNMSSVHAPAGTNCEQDLCQNLHAFVVSNDNCEAAATCDIEYLPNINIVPVEEKNDPRIMSSLHYLSGYFAKMAKAKIFKNCSSCSNSLITNLKSRFISYREYEGRQWLCSPTEPLIECISAIQDINYTISTKYLDKKNLKELIKTHIHMFIDFNFMNCDIHQNKLIEYLINITCRFFIYNYCKEVNKIISGKRDCQQDDEGIFKIKAKKYFLKCSKRPLNK